VARVIGLALIAAVLLALAMGKTHSFSPMGYAIAAVLFLEYFHLFPSHG
jgi:AGZA family xanthine/uracil permease-like MFS transporter